MAEMMKAIKLTPHDHNVHLKLRDVLSQGNIILRFPCLSDERVRSIMYCTCKSLSQHSGRKECGSYQKVT